MRNYEEMLRLYNSDFKKIIDKQFGDNRFDRLADEIDNIQMMIQSNYSFLVDYDMELDSGYLLSFNEIELMSSGRFKVDGKLNGKYDEEENFFENNSDRISVNPVMNQIKHYANEKIDVVLNNNKYTKASEEELMEKIRINKVVNEQLVDDINNISNEFMTFYNDKFL